jgi:cytochrome c oxidase assembly protein Cox11
MVTLSKKPIKDISLRRLSNKHWIIENVMEYKDIKDLLLNLREIIKDKRVKLNQEKKQSLFFILPITLYNSGQESIQMKNIILTLYTTRNAKNIMSNKKIGRGKLRNFIIDITTAYFNKIKQFSESLQSLKFSENPRSPIFIYFDIEDSILNSENLEEMSKLIIEKIKTRYPERGVIFYCIYHILYPQEENESYHSNKI